MEFKKEKHDLEKSSESLKIDNDYYKKKYKVLKKRQIFLSFTEILTGTASTMSSSTKAVVNPSAGNIKSSISVLLTATVTLITIEGISKF